MVLAGTCRDLNWTVRRCRPRFINGSAINAAGAVSRHLPSAQRVLLPSAAVSPHCVDQSFVLGSGMLSAIRFDERARGTGSQRGLQRGMHGVFLCRYQFLGGPS